MEHENYQTSITTSASPQQAFAKICDVSAWWAIDLEGKSAKLHDIFTVRFKNGDKYTCKIAEIVPSKKIVWDVIDSFQGWHDNRTEWNGTQIVWEIVQKDTGSEVKMTHIGLVPEFECFEACNQGWDYLTQKSLQKLLDSNEGMPV